MQRNVEKNSLNTSLLYFRSLQNYATCGIQISDWRCLSATSSSLVGSRASPAVLSMWSWRVKLDEEKSKYATVWLKKMVLCQDNCGVLQWLVKATATLCTCRKECNKYDLTAAQRFWLVQHTDRSRWFATVVPHLFHVPVSVLWVGLKEK
jgi:hypothetical protein